MHHLTDLSHMPRPRNATPKGNVSTLDGSVPNPRAKPSRVRYIPLLSPRMGAEPRLRTLMRAAAGDRGRALVRRVALHMGVRPRVNLAAAGSIVYPGGRRAAVIISADLELAWAWRYARGAQPEVVAQTKARRGRRNLSVVLDLCDRYDVPITWATVGHLFLESCGQRGPLRHPEIPRIPYFENEFWSYRSGDWFDGDPACGGPSEPEWWAWYGPDLVRSIQARRAAHEIACHTFSHVAFTDAYCPPEVAAGELRRCNEAASRFDIALRSFVFPGNLPGNHARLSDAGFTAYRHRTSFDLDVPRRDTFGLWQIPGGVSLENPFTSWSVAQQVRALERYLDVAIQHGLLCGLWFHPETDPSNVDEVLPRIFAYLASHRSEVWIGTMGDLSRWLDAHYSPAM
jgi:hypothetical protein